MAFDHNKYANRQINYEDSYDVKVTHPVGVYEVEVVDVDLEELTFTKKDTGDQAEYTMSKWRFISPLGMDLDCGIPIWPNGGNGLIRNALQAVGVDTQQQSGFEIFSQLAGRRCVVIVSHKELISKKTGKPFVVHNIDQMFAISDPRTRVMTPQRFGGTQPSQVAQQPAQPAAQSRYREEQYGSSAQDVDDIPF